MARPSKFAHVVYSTRRFDEMIDWYQRVFEATVVYQNPAFAFLTYDDEHHRFAFANLSILTGVFIMESHFRFTTRILTAIEWSFKWTAVRSKKPMLTCGLTLSPRIRR